MNDADVRIESANKYLSGLSDVLSTAIEQQVARDKALILACCAAIQEACEPCGGNGATGGGSRPDHGCGGDEKLCAWYCPVEVQVEPDQCEYCGRPIAAIREKLAGFL